VAVGGKKFVERIKEEIGCRAIGRKIHGGLQAGTNILREPDVFYSVDSGIKNGHLSDENGLFWYIYSE
jgi:hypothetical protein